MAEQEAPLEKPEPSLDTDALIMVSGLALAVFGVGLILTSPIARRYLQNMGIQNPTETVLPDIARYFKLRSM